MAKITITVEMNERWISPFCSFLKAMENNGKLGHSGLLGFYADEILDRLLHLIDTYRHQNL